MTWKTDPVYGDEYWEEDNYSAGDSTVNVPDELAEARATIADHRNEVKDLRYQIGEAHKRHKAMADALAVRADENQRLQAELRRLQYELRKALTCSCQAQTQLDPSAWNPDCPQHGVTSEWYEAEQGRRTAQTRITELESQVADLLRQNEALLAERDLLNEHVKLRNREDFHRTADLQEATKRAEQAEAEAAQTKAELRRMETRVSNYRAALERRERATTSSGGWSVAAEREDDGYDPLGTERWVDGEPSNDISQWETNGTSID